MTYREKECVQPSNHARGEIAKICDMGLGRVLFLQRSSAHAVIGK